MNNVEKVECRWEKVEFCAIIFQGYTARTARNVHLGQNSMRPYDKLILMENTEPEKSRALPLQ